MEPGENQPRIKLSIRMPSQALSRFIERALQDDKFFESAIDDPLTALKGSGVRLDLAKLAPSDLATFFGALAAVKELVKKKQLREISFERIFGQAAEILGTTIVTETQRGMWTQFDRNAFAARERCTSVNTRFETLREALADRQLTTLAETDLRGGFIRDRQLIQLVQVMREGIGETVQSRETDRGVSFHFDADKGIGSSTSSKIDTYSTKNFSGISLIEQVMSGPLINPVDLVAIAAQLETYVRIVEQTEEL